MCERMQPGVRGLLALIALVVSLRAAEAPAVPVTALVYHPDGSALFSARGARVEVRSAEAARVVRSLDPGMVRVTGLGIAAGGRFLVVVGGEPGVRGEVLMLAWPEGRQIDRVGDFKDLVLSVAVDVSSRRVLVTSADHTARLFEVAESGSLSRAFDLVGHAGPVRAAAFEPHDRLLITAGADRALKIWSAQDGSLVRSMTFHTEAVQALALGPDQGGRGTARLLASASDDRTVRVWQPGIGRMVRIVRGHGGAVLALAWSREGQALYSAGEEGVIRRIAANSDLIEARWQAHDDWIYALAISPDGRWLASGDWRGQVKLHRLGDGDGAR